ncbi:MAG: NAD-dependent epimerase/dehydratase [uncultured bacterium]|nr:MAG: NAD-dependent epimerase/dehydratase [uncultured bacterium]
MNILITGATGFIGGAVARRLLNTSSNVKILVRDGRKARFSNKITVHKGDIRDYKSVEKAFRKIDVVINCAAALPHHKLPEKDYFDINVSGVQNIVNACIAKKVGRLIHISTVGIYGSTFNKNINENSKPNPEDAYAKSKYKGEEIINNSIFKSSSVIIRPTIAYGPGDIRPVFLRLFKMINNGINISIGGGNNYFHTVYIDNLVSIILQSIKLNQVLGKDFNVGDTVCPKMNDIVNEIIHIQHKKCVNLVIPTKIAMIAGKLLGIERTVRFVSENRRYDTTKVRNCFKLKDDVGISVGIKRTFDWYKKNNFI